MLILLLLGFRNWSGRVVIDDPYLRETFIRAQSRDPTLLNTQCGSFLPRVIPYRNYGITQLTMCHSVDHISLSGPYVTQWAMCQWTTCHSVGHVSVDHISLSAPHVTQWTALPSGPHHPMDHVLTQWTTCHPMDHVLPSGPCVNPVDHMSLSSPHVTQWTMSVALGPHVTV